MCPVLREAIFLHLFPPVIPGDLAKTTPATGWINPNYAPFGCTSSFDGQSIRGDRHLWRAGAACGFCLRAYDCARTRAWKGEVSGIQTGPCTAQSEAIILGRDVKYGDGAPLFVLIDTNELRLAWSSIGFPPQDGVGRLAGGHYWLKGLVEVDGHLISCHGERS